MQLVVEVLDAFDLKPKDGHGSASPYAEVEFEGQRLRTRTVSRDLNPVWNETLSFPVSDHLHLQDSTIDVSIYSDRVNHRSFLGRVRLSGSSFAPSAAEATVHRCPLDKRGLFSNIRGEIGLKVYYTTSSAAELPPPLQQSDAFPAVASTVVEEAKPEKKKKSEMPKEEVNPPVNVFQSIGASPPVVTSAVADIRHVHRAKAEPAMAVMQIHGGVRPPGTQNPEFELVETRPPLAGRLGFRGDKISSTYDLVEQMQYLYVSVVKARDLPAMDATGSLDPYVEVKLGNYKGVTRFMEKNQSPVWRQVFAFSKNRLQSHVLEVVVKDKDLIKDDFVGRVIIDLSDVPVRVPPDSPLAPQWYRLEDKKGDRSKSGEIMLGVWVGTQADEAFPDAWHSDAHGITTEGLSQTRSKVYFSPKLCYLRVGVIAAQDLIPSDRSRALNTFIHLQLGNQVRKTRPSPTVNPSWNEEIMFVASEPFDEPLLLSVEEPIEQGKTVSLGRLLLEINRHAIRRFDMKPVEAKWYSLGRVVAADGEKEKEKEVKFASKIHLKLFLDAGYHVLDESTHYSSNLQPSASQLRKPCIGVLELGILSARNLLPMKAGKAGRTTDAYCVAKYGSKWVRTRTLLDTLHPQWNEQYTWEVFDPCTVITIGVFDNCHVGGDASGELRDQRIGKVRIRLSTLEADRIYTHFYPLLVLQPSSLKKTGELHLAVRFTCTAWVNMIGLYARPLLPKMHYVQPIPVMQVDVLRHQAMQIVAMRLARAEPPLRREVVEYMLDVDSHMWSLRRSKANFYRIGNLLNGLTNAARWYDGIRNWRSPVTTILVHVLFLILVCFPELILPTIFLGLFVIGLWNYRWRPRKPPHMDTKLSHADFAHPDELDEEFDTFPTSRPQEIVRMRYDRLRSVAGRVQTVAGDLATQGERAHALLSWRDPRATAIFLILSLLMAVILYATPMQVIAVVVGIFLLRHPKFRSHMPSVPFNFYRRLPAKSDMML